MKVSVVETGYVGLVTGTCFSEICHKVTCVDIDEAKIEGLKHGVLPIYEPELEELVEVNAREGRLHFTTSLAEAAQDANTHLIAVGSPPGENGSPDLQYVLAVAKDLGQHMNKDYNVVVDNLSVPVVIVEKVRAIVQSELDNRGSNICFDVVSNPKFLKEGRPSSISCVGTAWSSAQKWIPHDSAYA